MKLNFSQVGVSYLSQKSLLDSICAELMIFFGSVFFKANTRRWIFVVSCRGNPLRLFSCFFSFLFTKICTLISHTLPVGVGDRSDLWNVVRNYPFPQTGCSYWELDRRETVRWVLQKDRLWTYGFLREASIYLYRRRGRPGRGELVMKRRASWCKIIIL